MKTEFKQQVLKGIRKSGFRIRMKKNPKIIHLRRNHGRSKLVTKA